MTRTTLPSRPLGESRENGLGREWQIDTVAGHGVFHRNELAEVAPGPSAADLPGFWIGRLIQPVEGGHETWRGALKQWPRCQSRAHRKQTHTHTHTHGLIPQLAPSSSHVVQMGWPPRITVVASGREKVERLTIVEHGREHSVLRSVSPSQPRLIKQRLIFRGRSDLVHG